MSHSPTGNLQGLGAVNPGATNQGPQTSLSSQVVPPLGKESNGLDTGSTETTTQTTSPAATNMDRCVNPPFGMESENQYLLVITTSIEQLSLGPSGDNLEKSSTAPSRGNTFQNHGWLLFSLGQPGQAVMGVPL